MPKFPVDFAGPSYFGGKNDQLVLCAGKGACHRNTILSVTHSRTQPGTFISGIGNRRLCSTTFDPKRSAAEISPVSPGTRLPTRSCSQQVHTTVRSRSGRCPRRWPTLPRKTHRLAARRARIEHRPRGRPLHLCSKLSSAPTAPRLPTATKAPHLPTVSRLTPLPENGLWRFCGFRRNERYK